MKVLCKNFDTHCIDNGRLGNQMFRYAFLKVMSLINNCNFYIRPSNNFLSFFETNNMSYTWDDDQNTDYTNYFETNPFHFDRSLMSKTNKDTNFHGFFQNMSYFQSYSNNIAQEFTINSDGLELAKNIMYSVTNDISKSLCIHVRRTDYLELKHKYGFISKELYENILTHIDYDCVFVVSDDITMVEHEFKNFRSNHAPNFIKHNSPLIDFNIMYLSNRCIIPNSTFSWWACYLSSINNPLKTIHTICPWIKNRVTNLYPKSWIVHKKSWQNPLFQ